MLDERQRTRGDACQTIFIGAGAVLASTAPWFLTRVVGLSNVAAPGETPITVRYAFYLGAAMLLFTVLWTELTSREYSPEEMAAFDDSPRQTVPHASAAPRSEEHTYELKSLMRISHAVLCCKKKNQTIISTLYPTY